MGYEYGELDGGGTTVIQTKNTGNIARQTISFAGLANPLVQSYRPEAEERLIESLKLKEKIYGRETAKYAWVLYHYAFLTNNQKRFDEAGKLAEEIINLRGKSIAEEHPLISAGLQMLAIAFIGQQKAEQAEPLLRESLALREKTLPGDHWILDTSKSILGECPAQRGKFDDAGKLLFDSLKNLQTKLHENHERVQNAAARIEKFKSRF